MTGELSISQYRIRGYHGLYPEEQRTGSMFRVSVRLQLEMTRQVQLSDTVNYELLYGLIHRVFDQREDLIEQVAFNLLTAIKEEFPMVLKTEVKLCKEGPLGKAGFDPEFTLSEF